MFATITWLACAPTRSLSVPSTMSDHARSSMMMSSKLILRYEDGFLHLASCVQDCFLPAMPSNLESKSLAIPLQALSPREKDRLGFERELLKYIDKLMLELKTKVRRNEERLTKENVPVTSIEDQVGLPASTLSFLCFSYNCARSTVCNSCLKMTQLDHVWQ